MHLGRKSKWISLCSSLGLHYLCRCLIHNALQKRRFATQERRYWRVKEPLLEPKMAAFAKRKITLNEKEKRETNNNNKNK